MTYQFIKDYAIRRSICVEADSLEEAKEKALSDYNWEEEEPCELEQHIYVGNSEDDIIAGDYEELDETF